MYDIWPGYEGVILTTPEPARGTYDIINVNKTCQFKTWCKGDKSNIENSTDHFCEDTRQNALAALTNLGRSRDPIFTAWTPSSFDDTMDDRNHFTE